jgi:hypothetical protein
MKAVLTWNQVSFKKTHDLDELKLACLPYAGDAAAQLAGIERLSQYAWRFRYPGAPYAPKEQKQKRPGKWRDSFWPPSPPGSNPSSVVEKP